jgi:hypothetical protein
MTVICTITFTHFITVQIIIPFQWSWKWKCLISNTITCHCCWHIWEPQVLHFIASALWVPHYVYYESNWNFVSYKICDKEDIKYVKYFAQIACFPNLRSSNPSQERYGCTNNILALNSLVLVFWSCFVEGISFRIAQVVLICFAHVQFWLFNRSTSADIIIHYTVSKRCIWYHYEVVPLPHFCYGHVVTFAIYRPNVFLQWCEIGPWFIGFIWQVH